MLSIFSYTDPAKYLSDAFKEKQKKNPAFSLRSWAQQLGMKSHGTLHAMLKGQRNIPKKYIPLFIKSFSLPKKEASFFEVLIDLQRAKSIEEKEMYMNRLIALAPKESREVDEVESYKFISEPIHGIIGELTQLKGFKNTLAWIKSHLRVNLNMKDMEEIINRLEKLEILERTKNGYKKNIKHIYTTKDVMNKAVQMNHKAMSAIASDQVSKQTVDEKEFNSITFNIKKSDLPKIKESIREFTDQIIQNYESPPKEGDETYHLNVQFFSLTKSD